LKDYAESALVVRSWRVSLAVWQILDCGC